VKLLVAVGEAVQGAADLPDGVVKLIQGSSEVLVLSPSEVTRIEWLTGGIDQARRIADERLGVVLAQLNEAGVSASGMTGDEQVTVAFADALRKFNADHILIALRRADRPAWRRGHIVDRLLEQFSLPVTVFLVGS
jgi:hypothetical protein